MKFKKRPHGAVRLKVDKPNRADELGAKYSKARDAEALQAGIKSDAAATIKLEAKKQGVELGKSKVIVGKQWTIGVTTVEQSPTLNIDKVKKLLGKTHLYPLCHTSVIDPAKVAKLLEKNKITKKQFLTFLDPATSYEKVLVYRTKKKKEEENHED